MVIGYGYFGAPIGTRNAAGEMTVNWATTNRTFTPVETFKVRFLVKAPTLTAPDLKAAIEQATRVVLPQGVSASASVQEIWIVTPSSQPGWFLAVKSVAVGRGMPTEVKVSGAELEQIGRKIASVPGVVAFEIDSVLQPATVANPPTGTTPNPATGTTPNPVTGTQPVEEPTKSDAEERGSKTLFWLIAIGGGIAWMVYRRK